MKKIGIIGDVLIDYTINSTGVDKMRLGGIFHAARGAWAMDVPYELCFFSPKYLDAQILDFASKHHGTCIKIGTVNGAPNLILIKDVKEVGNQGYELILRDERKNVYDFTAFCKRVKEKYYSDLLLFTGGFEIREILKLIKNADCKIHVDISNDIISFEQLRGLNKSFETIFLSSSSQLFLEVYGGKIDSLVNDIKGVCNTLIFKENRGGSRCFNFKNNDIISVTSQTKPIQHSVGVGDNYDISYITKINNYTQKTALTYASWFAMEYASTTFPDDFKLSISRLNNSFQSIKDIAGVVLPWEKRRDFNIYIAAPDFDYIDTSKLDLLVNSLRYHNFNPRLPIKENGQLTSDSTLTEKQEMCKKDMDLLYRCDLLIAVLLFDDPGTLIEVGLSISKGIPTLIFDPYNRASNCVLVSLPQMVTDDLDLIISEVFIELAKN